MSRSPLHCLGSVWVFGDSLRESYIFSLLQETGHWLDKIMDPPVQHGQASYGMWHVTFGAQETIRRIAARLIAAGTNPNSLDSDGRSALHYAALGGMVSLVEVLLKAGADPNIVEDVSLKRFRGQKVPHFVCSLLRVVVARRDRELTRCGASFILQVNGQTALHASGTHGHANIAKLLIDAGASVSISDKWGNTFEDIAKAVSRPHGSTCPSTGHS